MISSSSFTFERSIPFDPSADFEAFLKNAPAKWVVYLMSDADDRPVQLLCVKNLRYSLKRRLGKTEGLEVNAPLSKRVNYHEIVRKVAWKRVDSAFEADVVYLEAARQFFPQTYQSMTGYRPAWFVHVDPDAQFPRYVKTTDLDIRSGQLIGPIEDKSSAGKLIEDVSDWFDLCRYYHILVEAPHGAACAYKEMGKCPAPCDGSITIEQYRRLIEWSARAIVDPDDLIRDQTQRMQSAAAALEFESAAKIKAFVESFSRVSKGSYRHLRRLRDFNFLTLQHGPREDRVKAFLITPGVIDEIAGLPFAPAQSSDLMHLALSLASERVADVIDRIGAERIGVVTHHLFQSRATHGAFLPLNTIDERSIASAYRDLRKQKPPAESSDEGVVRELQAM